MRAFRSALLGAVLAGAALLSAQEAGEAPAPKKKAPAASAQKPAPRPMKLSKAAKMGSLLVDLNRDPKEKLLTLPGLTPQQADKIIQSRPFLSKAHLVSKGIMTANQYLILRDQVTAKERPNIR